MEAIQYYRVYKSVFGNFKKFWGDKTFLDDIFISNK